VRPHPQPRASWPSGDDNAGFYLIVILAGCCVAAYLLWTNYHGAISAAVIALHRREIGFIRHVTDRYDLADRQMVAADPNGVTLRDLYGISRDVGAFFRIPAAGLMLLLALSCMARAAPSRFRRAFDLDGLIREQAFYFPTTAAFVGRHLRLVPPASADPRPADYALTPEEWIARFAIARDGEFDEAAARRALARQLGPPWCGVERASPPVRCLFAAFALHRAERRAEALLLLGDLSTRLGSRDEGRPEGPEKPLALPDAAVAEADAILRDSALLTPALAVARRHAYTQTALMALLNAARVRAGVLAPGQFAWLKLVDRPFWYALHSLGFETEGFGRYLHPNPRVEAVGARDHWAAERIAGEKLIEPSLNRAIQALRKAAISAPRAGARSGPRQALPGRPASGATPDIRDRLARGLSVGRPRFEFRIDAELSPDVRELHRVGEAPVGHHSPEDRQPRVREEEPRRG
jgi:intracellular multiplication protein IcmP